MGDTIVVTGLILTALPLKEYDRRVELLTKEKGRISAFAQGARKGTSALSACTTPFTFGEYTLYAGRSSYNLRAGAIQKYFGDIAQDYDMIPGHRHRHQPRRLQGHRRSVHPQ